MRIPGIFHVWMAAVDAIWRTHIRGEGLCLNEGGTYKLFETLQPQDFARLKSNLGYHILNNGIIHLIRAHITVCWEQAMGTSDLQDFTETKPSWDTIDDLAQQILNKNFAEPNFEDLQDGHDSVCDRKWENQMLFN